MAKEYASVGEFNTALNAAIDGLMPEIGNILKPLSSDLAGKIKIRVSSTGKDSTGGTFTHPYSKGHEYKKKKKGKGAFGQEIEFKNFYYQGNMWDSFDFKTISVAQDYARATVGFTGQNAYMSNDALAMVHTTNESKGIADPNEKEELELVNEIGIAIGQYFERILG